MNFCRYLLLVLLLAAPVVVHAQREKLPAEDLEFVNKTWPHATRTSTGLRYVVLNEGGKVNSGDLIKPGDQVSVIYTGWLINGTVFDKTKDETKPFTFRVGRDQVIKGWDYALQLMRPGDHMLFIVPYELGYGTRGSLPAIPPRSTLIFEIRVVSVKKP